VTLAVARGWATVELERAAAVLTDRLVPGAVFEDAPRSTILGARCLRGRAEDDWIVLLEPDTEGRLAGYLARFGEGWAVTWIVEDDDTQRLSPGYAAGPLGDERLAEGSSVGGPIRMMLSAATIDR
jgi:hypothetical protein